MTNSGKAVYHIHPAEPGIAADRSTVRSMADQFVLDLVKVDKDGTEHWFVMRESDSDSNKINPVT